MNIIEHTQMTGLSAEKQAAKAIEHVLTRIRDDNKCAESMGFGTESFALLTEAAATLFGKPVREVREYFMGKK